MNRRHFIKNTTAATALVSMADASLFLPSKNEIQLTILHTNDVHSHIDPFPIDHPKYPNGGGVSRRAQLIDTIRATHEHVLVLDAGDSFQGTPYFNYFGGELEFKLMSKMGYDAMTLGNHEFDNGVEGLLAQLPHAKFDILNANYDVSKTDLAAFVKPYRVYKKGKVKIGVFGLGVELKGLVNQKQYGNIIYHDALEVAQSTANLLKHQEKCDFIICLSHVGYEYKNDPEKISDVKIAAQTNHIDIIIGGHTHTFLEKPSVIQNKDNQSVLVNQVGCFGLYLGRIDVFFNSEKSKINTRIINV